MENLFTYSDPDKCLIKEFSIYHAESANNSLVESGDDIWDVLLLDDRDNLDNKINVDTTVAPTNGSDVELVYNFRIKAEAAGGQTEYKDVVFTIKVCGDETINRLSPEWWDSENEVFVFSNPIRVGDAP